MAGQISPVGALLFPVQILRADGYVRTFAALNRHAKIYVGRADDDFVPRVAGNQGQEVMKKCLRLLRVLVHLPVGGHQLLSHESSLEIFGRNAWFGEQPGA